MQKFYFHATIYSQRENLWFFMTTAEQRGSTSPHTPSEAQRASFFNGTASPETQQTLSKIYSLAFINKATMIAVSDTYAVLIAEHTVFQKECDGQVLVVAKANEDDTDILTSIGSSCVKCHELDGPELTFSRKTLIKRMEDLSKPIL